MRRIGKIISGGQTGTDRAALDFALENNIATGGFIPKNRLAEDGEIPAEYLNLVETKTENYAERTELNVKNADATLLFSHGELIGGSLLTKKFAEKYKKPFLHVDFSASSFDEAIIKTNEWLDLINCKNLNIAGSRASEDIETYGKTKMFLRQLFK